MTTTTATKSLEELFEDHRVKEEARQTDMRDALWNAIWKEYVRYTSGISKVNALPFHQWAKTSKYSLSHV